MNQIRGVVIFLSLIFHAKCQNQPAAQPSVPGPIGLGLTVIIGILSIMFSLTIILLAYAKFCQRNRHNIPSQDQNFQGLTRSRSRLSGIDKTVIESLPFFRFSSLKGSKEGLECSVCISKFEETEILRLLPKCKHAFHMNCIDKWLESHSSCPLCRYKVDPADVKSITFSNSSRFLLNPLNLMEDPNLELFVQREQSPLNIESSFRKEVDKYFKKEELVVHEDGNSDQKMLHKFKHKIVISEVVIGHRWSDINSSDFLSLSSEMLGVLSGQRFSDNDHKTEKFEEDIQRKRFYNSNQLEICSSVSISSPASTSFEEVQNSIRLLIPNEKRSMSEIVHLPRFTESRRVSNRLDNESSNGEGNNKKEERIRRIWMQIAQRTVQWFQRTERTSGESLYKRQQSSLNV